MGRFTRFLIPIGFVWAFAIQGPAFALQGGPTPTPGAPCTVPNYGGVIDDYLDVANILWLLCPPDDYFATMDGGYVVLGINYSLPAETNGVLTVWFSGVCTLEYWFVGNTFSPDIVISGASPFVDAVFETEEIQGVYITENDTCMIDAVKLEPDLTPTATPTETHTPTPGPTPTPTETPTPGPTPTPTNTPGPCPDATAFETVTQLTSGACFATVARFTWGDLLIAFSLIALSAVLCVWLVYSLVVRWIR